MYKIIAIGILCIFNVATIECGKSATRVGLAGVATTGGGSSSSTDDSDEVNFSREESFLDDSGEHANEMEKIKHHLFITKRYDKNLRPVLKENTITRVTLDFTLRQILDLDEKNQVLKTYLWMRYSWIDEFLTWNESEFQGIKKIWVPSSTVWRPDMVLYEDTGNRDYNPRLPYLAVTSDGKVSLTEPTVFESTCSINIALFPFDYQICALTFTSWAIPSSDIDVVSERKSEALMEDIEKYFLKTGEWVVTDVVAKKTSENYGSILPTAEIQTETNYGTMMSNTSNIRKLNIDPTTYVKDVAPDRVTGVHWAYIRYSFLLKRNSSLYLQSMLFPAILLTTVALLGFYLPPDSGERIGLQITILLTFMVFLLTVGEMFPASTGPFIGVYFVMCMALLGVNLFMTVLVLHMHYMPSAAVVGKDENGEYNIKPVPKWIRILLCIAKFQFRKQKRSKESPTAQTVRSIMKTGKLSIQMSTENIADKDNNSSVTWSSQPSLNTLNPENIKIDAISGEIVHENGVCKNGHINNQIACTEDGLKPSEKDNNNKETLGHYDNEAFEGENRAHQLPPSGQNQHGFESPTLRHRSHHSSKTGIVDEEIPENKLHANLLEVLSRISSSLKKQDEQMMETIASEDIESEWKAMARTIDKFCMKFYLFLLIAGHIVILATAITQGTVYNKGITDE